MRHLTCLALMVLGAGCLLDRVGVGPSENTSSTTVTTGGGAATIAVVTNDASSSTTTGMGGMPSVGGMGGMGEGGSGGVGGGPTTDPLTDQALVVRYFLDEADTGTVPADALDAAPNPLALPLDYGMGNLEYSEVAPHQRGLTWLVVGDAGHAENVVGTKIINRLNNDKRLTIEMVAAIDAPMNGGARPLIIGKSDPGCGNYCDELGLRDTGRELRLSFNDDEVAYWPAPWSATQRSVIHVVVDSTQPNPDDRAVLYVNGVVVSSSQAVTLPLDATLLLSSDGSLSVGNRAEISRSPAGTIHYAAIYEQSFSQARVTAHANRLLVSDDSSWP